MTTSALGIQTISIITAPAGGNAEKVLRYLATNEGETERFGRKAGKWTYSEEDECLTCTVTISHGVNGSCQERTVILMIDAPKRNGGDTALHLTDTSRHFQGRYSIKKGLMSDRMTENDVRSAAHQLAATACRGESWQNGAGDTVATPFGPRRTVLRRKRRSSGWSKRRESMGL